MCPKVYPQKGGSSGTTHQSKPPGHLNTAGLRRLARAHAAAEGGGYRGGVEPGVAPAVAPCLVAYTSTSSSASGPADGPDRAATHAATVQEDAARWAREAERTPAAEDISRDAPSAVEPAAQGAPQDANGMRAAEQGSRRVPSAPSHFEYGDATTIQDYKDWLRSHNLEDLLQQPGGWKDRRKRVHLGKFVFPDRETYRSITTRTQLLLNRPAGICLETPY